MASTSSSREWISRTIFESVLILLGILGGFALNEWKDARDRAERVQTVMAAVTSEIKSNLNLLEEASAYDTQVVSRLRELRASGAKTIPPGTYPKGLFTRPQLVAAAWDSAKAGDLVNELPVHVLLAVGRAYESQKDYLETTGQLLMTLYATAFQPSTDVVWEPGSLTGVLSDFASREGRLIGRYKEALVSLAPAESPPPATTPKTPQP